MSHKFLLRAGLLMSTLLGLCLGVSLAGAQDLTMPEYELTGKVEAVGEGFIVMAGQEIDITGAVIDDRALRVGRRAEVMFRYENGRLVAREVDDGDDYWLQGRVQAVNGDVITVAGREIDVTRVKRYDSAVLNVGVEVRVDFERVNGNWLAWEVSSRRDDDDDDDGGYTLTGPVESRDGVIIVVAGRRFDISQAGDDDDDYSPGRVIKIRFEWDDDDDDDDDDDGGIRVDDDRTVIIIVQKIYIFVIGINFNMDDDDNTVIITTNRNSFSSITGNTSNNSSNNTSNNSSNDDDDDDGDDDDD